MLPISHERRSSNASHFHRRFSVLAGAGTQTSAESQPFVDGQAVAMPAEPVGLLISLGRKDQKVTDWDGQITLSSGKILALDIAQGNPKASAKDGKFTVRTIFAKMNAKKDMLTKPILRLTVDAPASAKVKVSTNHGNFEFALADIAAGSEKVFLEGGAAVQREPAAIRLTGGENENDYPALARAADGTLWLAYCEYRRGKPYLTERVMTGGFDELVPTDNGDQIRLKHFDGSSWGPALDVTDPALDIWRPAITVAKGRVHVSWSQQVAGNWEIYHRVYSPPPQPSGKGHWSETVRISTNPGTDYHVVNTTAANGHVWLAWQSWDNGFFQIRCRELDYNPGPKKVVLSPELAVGTGKANHWSPALAADSRGKVYVAYDTYEKGNYDVQVAEIGGMSVKIVAVADSAHFEARPSLVCDHEDRLWIAYEEGDEQWGKDYSTNMFRKIGFEENPGNALYIKRTVQVKCLMDGQVLRPAGDLQKAIAEQSANNRSVPRLSADAAGGIWLLYRHHPRPQGVGEVWNSFAVRYNGKQWAAPRRLAFSDNLMDNRPALAPLGQGILAVYSGDGRTKQQDRKRNDLFASVLTSSTGTQAAALVPDAPSPKDGPQAGPPQRDGGRRPHACLRPGTRR